MECWNHGLKLRYGWFLFSAVYRPERRAKLHVVSGTLWDLACNLLAWHQCDDEEWRLMTDGAIALSWDSQVSRELHPPIPVRSAAKSYITSWCIQNLNYSLANTIINIKFHSMFSSQFCWWISSVANCWGHLRGSGAELAWEWKGCELVMRTKLKAAYIRPATSDERPQDDVSHNLLHHDMNPQTSKLIVLLSRTSSRHPKQMGVATVGVAFDWCS